MLYSGHVSQYTFPMILSRTFIGYMMLVCAGWLSLSSCTLRQAGCTAGRITAMAQKIDDRENAALIACEIAVGCILTYSGGVP